MTIDIKNLNKDLLLLICLTSAKERVPFFEALIIVGNQLAGIKTKGGLE